METQKSNEIFGHSQHSNEEKAIHATGDYEGTSGSHVLPEGQRIEFGEHPGQQGILLRIAYCSPSYQQMKMDAEQSEANK